MHFFIRFDVIHERDGRTDGHRPGDGIYRAYAYHRAVKTAEQPTIIGNYVNKNCGLDTS